VQADEVRAHLAAFSLDLPALIDRDHVLAARAGATVTPQAAVFTPGGELAYSGRIDDLYAELGRPRHNATEHNLRYDNSAANPANPFSPPRRVRWGQQSTDEMGSITLEMLPVREADVPLHASAVRAHLTRAARGRMAARPQARRPGE
jgi:hypothetical protein